MSRSLRLDDGIDEDVEDVREHGAARVVGQPVDAEREQVIPRRHPTGNAVTFGGDLELPHARVFARHALEDREHEVCMTAQVVGVRHTVCVRHCVPHCFHVALRDQAAFRERTDTTRSALHAGMRSELRSAGDELGRAADNHLVRMKVAVASADRAVVEVHVHTRIGHDEVVRVHVAHVRGFHNRVAALTQPPQIVDGEIRPVTYDKAHVLFPLVWRMSDE